MSPVAGTPFSAFGQVGYASASSSGYNSNNWSILGGVRLFLDPPGTTLQGHDHLVPWNVIGVSTYVTPK